MDTEPDTQYADVATNRRAGLTGEDAYRPRTHDPEKIREADRPPVAAALGHVDGEIETLDSLVASLVERLGPVLDLRPTPTGTDEYGVAETGVELADALHGRALRLDSISDRVRFALDRLAL